ncbi:MAG: hypothetical protein HZA79_04725 [Sphingobacteriales bacterium]|nr:hypothetical protein [Sphingobacteriales bacterium]
MKKFIGISGLAVLMLTSCQKELSYEAPDTPAQGSLQSEVSGDCLPKTVNGTYEVSTQLVPANNSITINVDVIQAGTYLITTDTVDGFSFSASGIFTSAGNNVVTLRGKGTPFAAGLKNFVVSFDSTYCDVQVTVLPSGAGGPAVFTLEGTGTPASCSGATASGNYIIGSPLNSSNQVTLSVNVTTIGTYNITTTATNGMTFSGNGAFLTTGVQSLVLTGSGTPGGTPGAVTIPVTAGSSNCNFQVTTVAGATYSIDCASAVVNGNYQAGTALTASNTVDISVNVLTAGPYTISTTATNGMTFSASGVFAAPGSTNIQLAGSGTPAAGGTFNIPVPGTAACTFPVTCTAAPSVDWKFTAGTTTYQGPVSDVLLTTVLPPFLNLAYTGLDASMNEIGFNLVDVSGTINNNETYSTVISQNNVCVFTFIFNGGADDYSTDATRNLTFKVTNHNTSTKTITGTFSGQVKNSANATVNITNGTFTGVYQ